MAQPEYPKAVESIPADEAASPSAPAAPEPANENERDNRRYLIAGLVVLALVLVILLVRANGQIGELEGTVADLESQLDRSRATVAAHEAHLGEIRGEVDALVGHLGALDRLVDRDPVAAEPIPPAAPNSGGSGAPE